MSPTVTSTASPPRASAWLFPKEHGAYAQLLLPISTTLLVAHVTAASVAWIAAIASAFVAHEPALVLLGHRGRRARSGSGRAAVTQAIVLSLVSATCLLAALALGPRSALAAACVPLALAGVVAVFVWRRREKTGIAEVIVATTLACASLPVSIASGLTFAAAFTLALVWAAALSVQVLAVRGCIARGRSGGSPRGAYVAASVGGVLLAVAVSLAATHRLPWAGALALVPPTLAAVVLALRPVSTRHLREVGWTLASMSVVTLVVLAVASW